MELYFRVIFFSASSRGLTSRSSRLGAKESMTVTSQTSDFPRFHGPSVKPSGRLLSSRLRPGGSNTAGTLAELKVLLTKSFNCTCLLNLPALRLQDKP